jgi:hypothetical protein
LTIEIHRGVFGTGVWTGPRSAVSASAPPRSGAVRDVPGIQWHAPRRCLPVNWVS